MKRTIPVILSLCLTLTLAACGSGSGTTREQTTQETPAQTGQAAEPAPVSTQAESGYRVLVTDESGAPVSGATIQFCSDTECIMGKTGDDGVATFEQAAGAYTVHVLKVPSGYAEDNTEYDAPETPGLVTIVLRAEGTADDSSDVLDVPELGLHFEAPEKYQNAKGSMSWDYDYPGTGVQMIEIDYYAVSEDQTDTYADYLDAYVHAMMEGEDVPEAPVPGWGSGYDCGTLFTVFTINERRGEDELRSVLREYNGGSDVDFAWLDEIGSDGDSRFFVGQLSMTEDEKSEYQKNMGDLYEEYVSLLADKETFVSALTLSAPEWPRELAVGNTIAYTAPDLDGAAQNSADIFSKAKVTMINFWATWCGPCKRELPELANMAKEFEAQGCQIIGVCSDADSDEVAAEAREILSDAGVEYLNLRATDNVEDVFPVTAYPTTFFVDSEGRLLVAPVVGADLDGYRAAMEASLAQVG